jgi:predicted nucleotidyltransferase
MRTETPVAQVIHFLLGNTRAAVLRTLLLEPGAALHVRELARVTGASPGSLHRDLRALSGLGLLLREEIGHQVHYRANSAHPCFGALTELLRSADAPPLRPRQPAAAAPARQSPQVANPVAPVKLHIPRGRLAALCREHRIQKLGLFGAAARNALTPGSAVELLVEFAPREGMPPDMGALRQALSAAFGGRRVALATAAILDDPLRRDAILAELKTLYAG